MIVRPIIHYNPISNNLIGLTNLHLEQTTSTISYKLKIKK